MEAVNSLLETLFRQGPGGKSGVCKDIFCLSNLLLEN